MNLLLTMLFATTHLSIQVIAASSIRGPPVAGQRNVFVVGRLGEEVKLTCPMEGNPQPMIEWQKAPDRKINDFTQLRYTKKRRYLKIRELNRADSGRYVCRGINGFGVEQITIDLLVIDPADFPADQPLPAIAPPTLSPETANAREEFEKKHGDTFSVSCTVAGKPAPRIVWLKNGQTFKQQPADNAALLQVRQHAASSAANSESSTLRLTKLRDDDSGTYTCQGENLAGNVTKHYRLKVRNTLYEKPVFSAITPTNQTVSQGSTATLDCHVHSQLPITIKWLKKLEQPRERYDDVKVINVGPDSYRIIDQRQNGGSDQQVAHHHSSFRTSGGVGGTVTGGIRLQTSKEYVSKLELTSSNPSDSGMYICFATNTMGGYNYRRAHLTVLTAGGSESPLVLTISISLAGLTLLVLLGLMVCLVRNRSKKQHIDDDEPGSGLSGSEVRSTLICPGPTGGHGGLLPQQPVTGMLPPAPPPSVQDTLYSKTGHPLPPPPPTPVQWSMIYGGANTMHQMPSHHTSYTDSSQYGGGLTNGSNTYEVPRYATDPRPTSYGLSSHGGGQRVPPAGHSVTGGGGSGPSEFMYNGGGGYRH